MKYIFSMLYLILQLSFVTKAQINLRGIITNDECDTVGQKGCRVFKRVHIVVGNYNDITDDNGRFYIRLPNDYFAGSEVIAYVEAPGYTIFSPLHGRFNLPAIMWSEDFEERIILLPKGSLKFVSDASITSIMSRISAVENSRRLQDTNSKVNYSIYFKQFSKDYGLSYKTIKTHFDQWQRSKVNSATVSGLIKKGLQAYYRGDFKIAGIYNDSASKLENKFLREQQVMDSVNIAKTKLRIYANCNTCISGGNSWMKAYMFNMALESYRRADSLINNPASNFYGGFEAKRNELKVLIGVALWREGIRIKGNDGNILIAKSIDSFNSALEFYTKSRFPQDWAKIQTNLAIIFKDQATRTRGKKIESLFSQSRGAYQLALQVFTKETEPEEWANVQNNLGILFFEQGNRATDNEASILLVKAVDSYKLALIIRNKRKTPKEWASTQNNLGIALRALCDLDSNASISLLIESINAYKAALEVRTKAKMPNEWTQTQNGLAIALEDLAIHKGGDTSIYLLSQSVLAFRNVLQMRSREIAPQEWAAALNNLGNSLEIRGSKMNNEDGKKLIIQAIDAFRISLGVYTKEDLPQQWAKAQTNLGVALGDLAERTDSDERKVLCEQALIAFNSALEIRTKETLEMDWATTQYYLALLYERMGDLKASLHTLETLRYLNLNEIDKKTVEIENKINR